VAPPEAKDVGRAPGAGIARPFLWKPSPAPNYTAGARRALFSPSQYRRPSAAVDVLSLPRMQNIASEQLNAFAPVKRTLFAIGRDHCGDWNRPAGKRGKTLLKAKFGSGFFHFRFSPIRARSHSRPTAHSTTSKTRRCTARFWLDKNGSDRMAGHRLRAVSQTLIFCSGRRKRLLAIKAESVMQEKEPDLTEEILL